MANNTDALETQLSRIYVEIEEAPETQVREMALTLVEALTEVVGKIRGPLPKELILLAPRLSDLAPEPEYCHIRPCDELTEMDSDYCEYHQNFDSIR